MIHFSRENHPFVNGGTRCYQKQRYRIHEKVEVIPLTEYIHQRYLRLAQK